MKKNLFILVGILLNFQLVISQEEPSESLRTAFQDGEFFFAREAYIDALAEYMSVYKRGYDNNANLNYRIGVSYLNLPGQKDKSIPYLQKAIQDVSLNHIEGQLREKTAPIDAFLYLGDAYRIDNQLDKAILSYTKYIEYFDSPEDINVKYANSQIKACKYAKELMAKPVVLETENLGEEINTSGSNFAAVTSGDGSTLVYMSELPFYTAVFMCTIEDDGSWSTPINLTPQIQSDGDQSVACLSYNADELYLVQEGLFNSDILFSERLDDGSWSPSRTVGKNINTKFWESHATLSQDGNTLYFTSNRRESIGGMDIFYSTWNQEESEWNKPVNLGPTINTPLNEDFPFVTPDGTRLYFSSQGHKGMGGYDIYYATLNDTGVFDNPVNVGYPINTTDNDNFFFPIDNGSYGLKALIAEDGYGKEDIYKLKLIGESDHIEYVAEEVETDIQEETEVQDTAVEIAEQAEEEVAETIPEKVEEEVIEEPKEEQQIAEPVKAMEFTIYNILFDFDSYQLTNASKLDLDRYNAVVKTFPDVKFKLYGYTDALGDEEYNLVLSKNRANAVKAYLIKLGAKDVQISTYARGEADPIADNVQLHTRKQNRRVEITITGVDESKLKISEKQ
jgi:outer membrane protein OmpA-like peptidoglycan-associated protein